MNKLGKRYGVDYVEVRVVVRVDKDTKLFNAMREFPEVSWTGIARKGIEEYIANRKRGTDNA